MIVKEIIEIAIRVGIIIITRRTMYANIMVPLRRSLNETKRTANESN